MTKDATTQLRQEITKQLPASELSFQGAKANWVASLNTFVSIWANYVQILTAIPQVVKAGVDAANAVEAVASGTAVAAAAAGAASGGLGAVVVVIVAAIIALFSAIFSSSDDSAEASALNQIYQAIVLVKRQEIDDHWEDTQRFISSYWGNVYDDLGNIAASNWPILNAAQNFRDTQSFITQLTNLANGFWDKPLVYPFTAQQVPYTVLDADDQGDLVWNPATTMGWYGNLPQPPQDTSYAISGYAADPRSMLPMLMYAVQSFLSVNVVANLIDPTQNTFQEFLQKYGSVPPAPPGLSLSDYATFIYDHYTYAIGAMNPKFTRLKPYGLVKSDIPRINDVMGFIVYQPSTPTSGGEGVDVAGSSPYAGQNSPSRGDYWNGVYGVVDQFGVYPSAVAVPSSTPQCIINIISTAALPSYLGHNALTYPWVQNKLRLGLMARWKALYLYNGYDSVWAFLQNLCALAGLTPYPTQHLLDGTIANQNWSARELITILSANDPNYTTWTVNGNNSLYSLIQYLDELKNGSWTGAAYTEHANNQPVRPVGFRDRLAAVAV